METMKCLSRQKTVKTEEKINTMQKQKEKCRNCILAYPLSDIAKENLCYILDKLWELNQENTKNPDFEIEKSDLFSIWEALWKIEMRKKLIQYFDKRSEILALDKSGRE